jgi:hypothetical protein
VKFTNYRSTVKDSMSKTATYILSALVFLLSVHFSMAQGSSARASIDRSKILIGEPITLTLEATVPVTITPTWFPLDSIPHFEYIDFGKIDSTVSDDHKYYKQVLSITSFDSGRWVIPSLSLEMNGRYYVTDSLPVSVAFSNFDPNQDYHDIKDILEVDNPALAYVTWALAAVTLLSLIALIYFLRKSRLLSRPAMAEAKVLDPFAEAMLALESLRKEQLPERGEVKRYYTSLNDVIRRFINRKMGLSTMEKTNEELILQVKQTGIPHEEMIRLAQTLRMSDAVKFARYVPASEDNEQSFRTTETTVQLLNNLNGSAV